MFIDTFLSFQKDEENIEDAKFKRSPPGSVYIKKDKDILLNEGRKRVKISVSSICDRPIQVSFNSKSTEHNLNFKRILKITK